MRAWCDVLWQFICRLADICRPCCCTARAAVVKCSVELGNYVHLSNFVMKAESTPEAQVGGMEASFIRS
jgi:hypothetical protein